MDKIIAYFKHERVWGFLLSVAVMAIISLVYFAPDNFEGNSLNQSDMLQGEANGHEAADYHQQTGEKALWTNSLFSGMPTFQISPSYASNALFDWLNGLFGLWLPAPSNLMMMMMLGFFILLYCMGLRWYYSLIGAVAWAFSSYFVIIIGAGHIWKFVALSYIPPTIGGLVLCYRGRYLWGGALTALFAMLQLNANHPQMTYYFAFVMMGFAVVYLVDAIRQKRVVRWAVASAVVAGAGMLALGANLPSLYNTYEYAKETKRTQSELTPVVDTSSAEPAERPTGGLPKSQIVGWSYGRGEMFSLLVPNVRGGATSKAENGQPTLKSLAQLPAAKSESPMTQQLLEYFTQYFNDSEGTNGPVYVGALIFALFLMGLVIVRGPMKWCLAVLTVLSMLLSLGYNFESLTDLMIYNFPMYNKFRAVESILVIAEFTMPLLAILALVAFLQPRDEKTKGRDRRQTALYVSFGLCALVCLVGMAVPSVFGEAMTQRDMAMLSQIQEQNIPTYDIANAIEHLRYGMVRSDCMRSLLFLVLGFAALYMYNRGKMGRNLAIGAVGVLVLVDLYSVDKRYVDHGNFLARNPYADYNTSVNFVPDAIDNAILQDTAMSYRVLDVPGFGDARRSYFHKMIGGYHAAKLNRYEDLIQRRMSRVLAIGYHPELRVDSVVEHNFSPEQRMVIEQLRDDYRVLDMLNTKYIINEGQNAPTVNEHALGNAWLINRIDYVDNADAEMAALSTLDPATRAVADKRYLDVLGNDVVAPAPGDTIYMTSYSPNRLTYHVNTAKGGIGVFSEVYFPWGWKADIDGKPAEIARVNYILRALRIPAGSHTVTMWFDPESIHTTTNIAYACVTLIYLLVIAGIFVAVTRKGKCDGDGVA